MKDTNTNTLVADVAALLDTYKPSQETVKLVRETPVTLLVGISGAGKDTIKHRLLEMGEYHHIVSHTTRQPRMNGGVLERDGEDYHFIELSAAKAMLENGAFVEAKMYSGNVYGTSVSEIQAAHDDGKIALTDIEVQGVAEYKAISKGVIAVFILPPDYESWQERLKRRYEGDAIDPVDMAKRMQTAILELQLALESPYYHFVVNDDLEQAIEIVHKIAHNRDIFNEKDAEVRQKAEELLSAIRKFV